MPNYRVVLTVLLSASFISTASAQATGIATAIPMIRVSPPTTEEAWSCANWSRDTWYVEMTDSGPLGRPVRAGDMSPRLTVPTGELRGINHGEFGGYLTFRAVGSSVLDTVLRDNPVALLPHGSDALMVAGLGHLSLREGHVVLLRRSSTDTWTAEELVDLKTAPAAALKASADTLLVATSEGVLGVSLSRRSIFAVFRNDQWYLLYATSLVRSADGTLYVGMRRAIVVLRPERGTYVESWLVPSICPTLRQTDQLTPCSCS